MAFRQIDMDNWERKGAFEHFTTIAKSSYSLTVNVDITKFLSYIRKNDYRLYPAFTWVVSKALNNHTEFKMGFDENSNLGYYDTIYPGYAVLNNKIKQVNNLCTEYKDDFKIFYRNMVFDMDSNKETGISPKWHQNTFIVSCLPWLSYSSFSTNNESEHLFLFPMVVWGKYFEQGERTLMPLTLQIHHAVADGYHCSLFYKDVDDTINTPEAYLI